jgi:hypothetical protein
MIKYFTLLLLATAPAFAQDDGVNISAVTFSKTGYGYLMCTAYNRARPVYDAMDVDAAKPYQKAAELFFKAAMLTDASKPEAEVSSNVNSAKALMIELHKKGDATALRDLAEMEIKCKSFEAKALELVEAAEEEALGNAT